MSLWAARFAGGTTGADELFRRFNDSLPIDHRLLPDDAHASAAWARALAGVGVITDGEASRLTEVLRELSEEYHRDPNAVARAGDEDVHSFVERRLIEALGDLGKKLHTGRSRNDQVATDLRLYLRRACGEREHELNALRGALLDLAEREADTAFPGYTHLQRAQPVLVPHWCLSWFHALARDAGRFADARRRLNTCPLGSAALAGSAYPVDRASIAAELGFDGPTLNAMDAVAARDAALEVLAACSIAGLTLSRLAEDLIVYSSGEFALLELPDAVATGSSIMPQKKNPDGPELVRGKAGRLVGAFVTLATVSKGLPSSYNKDLQEDKQAIFDALDQLSMMLRVTAAAVGACRVERDRARDAARSGHANATDLADALVARGVPFRDAHAAAGAAVREALQRRCAIEDLPDEQLTAIHPSLDAGVRSALTLESVLAKRDVIGGTAPARVREALEHARRSLALNSVGGRSQRADQETRDA